MYSRLQTGSPCSKSAWSRSYTVKDTGLGNDGAVAKQRQTRAYRSDRCRASHLTTFRIAVYHTHWGQTPVSLVRTFREHCQEMHSLLRTSWPRTLQVNSEFTSQFTDNILSGTHVQYIQDVPGYVTAVFPLGKLWENSGFTEQCSCSVPKWLSERTLPLHFKFPDYVMAMYPLGKLWENLKISQRRYPSFSLLGHWECTDNVPDM